MNKKLLLSFLIMFSAVGLAQAQLEIPHYDIKATIDTINKTLEATETVFFVNASSQSLSEIQFHVYPARKYSQKEISFMQRYGGYFKVHPYPQGFQDPEFKIVSASDGTANLAFELSGEDQTILKIRLPQPLAPGQKVEVTLQFTSKIPHTYGRFGWHENIIALSRWYPILAVFKNGEWQSYPFYPFHRPFYSDAATYRVELNVPQDQIVIHSGFQKEMMLDNPGSKKLFLESDQPIREFSLALSPDYQLKEELWNNVQLKVYYLEGDEGHAQKALENIKTLMTFYAERFGPYPYKEFSIAPVYLGYGGEQMSNMALIDTRVFKLPEFLDRYFDFLIAHETGHQWFYNLIGIDEYKEIWLEEGVHSYFIAEYLEKKYGPNAEIIQYPHWLKEWKWIFPELTFRRTRDIRYKIMSRTGWDKAVVNKLSSFQEPSSIFSITYGKGSMVVGALENFMGQDAFDQAFRRIFKEYQHKNLSIEEFINICSEEGRGKPVREFLTTLLYADKKMDYSVERSSDKKLKLVNRGGISVQTKVKVNMKAEADGNPTFDWDGNEKSTYLAIDPKKIESVAIDPESVSLDIDRINNYWPRKFLFKPVPFYWPLYDHPLFLPEDSYNVVVGPEVSHGGIGVKASFQKPYDYNVYTATDYEFSESILHSRAGFQFNNLFENQTSWGAEVDNRTDYDNGEEDLVSGKLFIRRELWPAAYGLGDINDHVSLYMIRNQGLSNTLLMGGSEEDRNISYLKRNEAIIGANFHLNRSGPSFDPKEGYKLDTFFENSGHFFNATQQFSRGGVDVSFYQPVCPKTTLAYRFKYGGGFPDERNLFELGGMDGLRGYDRKEVRGSSALLGSLEFRFPLKENINWHLFDNILGIDSLSGVIFTDVGESWYSSMPAADLKKDAGVGLRLTVNAGSFLEKVIVRLDVAQAINDDTEDDPHFWFGINHAF